MKHVVCRDRDDGGPCVFTPDEEYAQKSREPAATSQVLAGPADGECEDDWGDIQAADTWAKQMIDYREGRKVR